MLFLIRSLTAFTLFVIGAAFFTISLFIGVSATAGGFVGAKHPGGDGSASREAGQAAVRHFGPLMVLCAVILALIISAVLSFGGVFPWCRKPQNR